MGPYLGLLTATQNASYEGSPHIRAELGPMPRSSLLRGPFCTHSAIHLASTKRRSEVQNYTKPRNAFVLPFHFHLHGGAASGLVEITYIINPHQIPKKEPRQKLATSISIGAGDLRSTFVYGRRCHQSYGRAGSTNDSALRNDT